MCSNQDKAAAVHTSVKALYLDPQKLNRHSSRNRITSPSNRPLSCDGNALCRLRGVVEDVSKLRQQQQCQQVTRESRLSSPALLVRCTTAQQASATSASGSSPQKNSKRKESLKDRLNHFRRLLLDSDGGGASSVSATASGNQTTEKTVSSTISSAGRFWKKRFGGESGSRNAVVSRYCSAEAAATAKEKKAARDTRILRSFSHFDLHSFLSYPSLSSSAVTGVPTTAPSLTTSRVALHSRTSSNLDGGNLRCSTVVAALASTKAEAHRQTVLTRECSSTSSIDAIAASGQDNEDDFIVANSNDASTQRRPRSCHPKQTEQRQLIDSGGRSNENSSSAVNYKTSRNAAKEDAPAVAVASALASCTTASYEVSAAATTRASERRFHRLGNSFDEDRCGFLVDGGHNQIPEVQQQLQTDRRHLGGAVPSASADDSFCPSLSSRNALPAGSGGHEQPPSFQLQVHPSSSYCSSSRASSCSSLSSVTVVNRASSPLCKKPSRILKRSKAVDLSCGESTTSTAIPGPTSSDLSVANVRLRSSSTKQQQEAKKKPSFKQTIRVFHHKSSNDSILRKLIFSGTKTSGASSSSEAEALCCSITGCSGGHVISISYSLATSKQQSILQQQSASAVFAVPLMLPSQDSSLSFSLDSAVPGQLVSSAGISSCSEERQRKRFFAHYDCLSICTETSPLLAAAAAALALCRSKQGGSSSSSGGSGGGGQQQQPIMTPSRTAANIIGSPTSSFDVTSRDAADDLLLPSAASPAATASSAGSMTTDPGDGKSNDLVVSCSCFRNEIGGEPVRHIALSTERYRNKILQPMQPQRSSSAGAGKIGARAASMLSSTSSAAANIRSEELETWHRTSSAAEASVLENLCNIYLGGRLCASRQPQLVIEHVDHGAFYYRHCFFGKVHLNYFGIDENLGPVAISIVKDKVDSFEMRKAGLTVPALYRIIIRLSDLSTFRGSVLEESLPSFNSAKEQFQQQQQPQPQLQQVSPVSVGSGSSMYSGGKIPVKELLDLIIPELQQSCLRVALPVPRTEEMLLRLDEQSIYIRYKVGILYCKAGQCTEEQLYNNEYSGPAFEEFLDILGQRVRLKGFDKYKGGLDNKGDSTGMYSLYTMYQQYEIMFHVSTMLPFTASNRQQLARKRHIGNDIVTIIFQEPGALPFSPQTMRSHFQHVFIIVRVSNPNTDNVRYRVAVSRCKGVAAFGPPISRNAYFPKSREFRELLLTKIINAENAVHKSAKFEEMAARTRRELMRELSEHYITSQSLEGTSVKIANKILGPKRKDRLKPKVFLDSCIRGAITWDVQVLTEVEDFSLCRPIECHLGISMDYLVLIEHSSKNVLFCTPTHSVIGWTSHGNSVKLYYDHADVIILRTLDDDDAQVMNEIIRRLQFVSKGCETVRMMLRRNPGEPLGLRIQHEGIVSDVDMYSCAWQAGLRQGSRIVEICKVSVSSLRYEKILELLNISSTIRVLVIPSLEDGSPRRGCEDPYCSAVLGDQAFYVANWNDQPLPLPPHPPGKLPPSFDKTPTARSADFDGSCLPGQKSSSDVRDHGYESGSNSFSTKSFEEVQSRMLPENFIERASSTDRLFLDERRTSIPPPPSEDDGSRMRFSVTATATGSSVQSSDRHGTSGFFAHSRSHQLREIAVSQSFNKRGELSPVKSNHLPSFSISPHVEKRIKCSSFVDLTARTTEGLSKMDINRCSSTEFSGCHFKLQASQKRIEMLENKVQRLQNELNTERDSKCLLEMENLKLKEVNKTLKEECQAAKTELKQFTQWFFSTLENPVSHTPEYIGAATQDQTVDDIQSV